MDLQLLLGSLSPRELLSTRLGGSFAHLTHLRPFVFIPRQQSLRCTLRPPSCSLSPPPPRPLPER